MRPSTRLALGAAVAVVVATAATTSAQHQRDLGREVLAPNDGWASEGSGTTGGSTAVETQVYTVTNRAELIAALNNGVFPAPPNDTSSSNTNASDFVTVSWNRLENHDKLMLIGSSDSAAADRNKLRVTLHHNLFSNIGQRAPRVRFGQVHVYNNFYSIRNEENYQYTWGVGIESQHYAENNFFATVPDITAEQFISRLNGTAMFETGTLVNWLPVDVVGAYNAANDPDIVDAVTWTPILFLRIDRAEFVPVLVLAFAGPFSN